MHRTPPAAGATETSVSASTPVRRTEAEIDDALNALLWESLERLQSVAGGLENPRDVNALVQATERLTPALRAANGLPEQRAPRQARDGDYSITRSIEGEPDFVEHSDGSITEQSELPRPSADEDAGRVPEGSIPAEAPVRRARQRQDQHRR